MCCARYAAKLQPPAPAAPPPAAPAPAPASREALDEDEEEEDEEEEEEGGRRRCGGLSPGLSLASAPPSSLALLTLSGACISTLHGLTAPNFS